MRLMNGLKLRVTTVVDKLSDIFGLLEDHREELATNKELMKLNPDVDKYKIMEEDGCLMSILVYDGDDVVGYSVNVLGSNLHYSDIMTCQNDVLYLDPKYRKSGAGRDLIMYTEACAKKRGCNMILWHSKQDTSLEQLLPTMGCSIQDVVFSKEL